MIAFMIFSIVLFLVLFVVLFVWGFKQINQKQKGRSETRDTIYQTHKVLLDRSKWFHVHYFRNTSASSIYSTGILYITNREVGFIPDPKTDIAELNFSREQLEVEWVGVNFHSGSYASWFKISFEGKEYFFLVESGAFILGSKKTTKEIFETLVKWKQFQ